MSRRIADHVRSNVVGYVAVFIALSGTAWALERDSVRSKHIVDDQVKSQDVRDDSLTGGGLQSADIAADALTGADIDESSLGKVPDADAVDGVDSTQLVPINIDMFNESCDVGNVFLVCASLTLDLPRPGRVFAIATGTAFTNGSDAYQGECKIEVNNDGIGELVPFGESGSNGNADPVHDVFNRGDGFAIQGLSNTLTAGQKTVEFECLENDAAFLVRQATLTAMLVSPPPPPSP